MLRPQGRSFDVPRVEVDLTTPSPIMLSPYREKCV